MSGVKDFLGGIVVLKDRIENAVSSPREHPQFRPKVGKKKMGPWELAANAKGAFLEKDAEHNRTRAMQSGDKHYAREAVKEFLEASEQYRIAAGGDNFASERAEKSAKATSENYLGEPLKLDRKFF